MNMTKKRKKNYLTDYLYILPAAAFVGIFFVSSILYTFYLSFFEWDGFSEKIFVGLNNYKNLGSIIFFVGLTLPRYRFSKPSASLDMNLR